MGTWLLQIDRDFQRAGLDEQSLCASGLEVQRSERLSGELELIAVLSYVGDTIFKAVVSLAVKEAIARLVEFARSKGKRLKLEVEQAGFDERVSLVAANIEGASPDEYSRAVAALPALKARVDAALANVPAGEGLKGMWYVWQDGNWGFSYYMTEGGDIVETEPSPATSARSLTEAR